MEQKNLVATIFIKNGKAVKSINDMIEIGDAVELAKFYNDNGIDKLILIDLSKEDDEHETNILVMREINRSVDVKSCAGGNIKRLEDIKKYLYAGCIQVMINTSKPDAKELIVESSKRFGDEKVLISMDKLDFLYKNKDISTELVHEIVITNPSLANQLEQFTDIPYIQYINEFDPDIIIETLSKDKIRGIHGDFLNATDFDAMKLKSLLSEKGIKMDNFEPKLKWSDLKCDKSGLVPVIVQDYRTNAVLMLAYMDEEAFNSTIKLGKMTYHSRSRNELWVKGETSGHIQYVKSLTADCDKDTILAKVSQVGGIACHTGAPSCFFNEIIKKEYIERNPLRVLENVYNVISDRKTNPKEGSYTNYLFDKGIDKILKKVGEEATEIVIAAKNPESEEMVYEMSDFLYHAMVLMVEKNITWEDITRELSQR